MPVSTLRKIGNLELEEQILNGGALVALVGVFLPWIGGEWLGGDSVRYTGLGFYTSFMGLCVLVLQIFILAITLIPLTGGPVIIRKRYRDTVRFFTTSLSTILLIAALSVLTKVTFEFSRMEIRFGIYIAIIGSLLATVYAYLKYQEFRRSLVQELFHHPEDQPASPHHPERQTLPTPPPAPSPPAAEDHRLFRS